MVKKLNQENINFVKEFMGGILCLFVILPPWCVSVSFAMSKVALFVFLCIYLTVYLLRIIPKYPGKTVKKEKKKKFLTKN